MPQFVCDAMLGSLARWLRFFGFDTIFFEGAGRELLDLARRDGRWLVTRNGALAARGPRSICLMSETLDGQLKELFTRLDLHPVPDLDNARCSACNGELENLPASKAIGHVPPHVARTANRFRRCQTCGRIYWRGTHTKRIVERMQRICATLDAGKGAPA